MCFYRKKRLGMKEATPGVHNWYNFVVNIIVLKGKDKNDIECLWNKRKTEMKHKRITMC